MPKWSKACANVASDLGLGGVFCRVLRFLPLQVASHELVSAPVCDSSTNYCA